MAGLRRPNTRIAWAATNAGWIIDDDYDSEFRFDTRPLPCLQGLDVEGRVIHIGTFSKSVFPARSIGFVIVSRSDSAERNALCERQVARVVDGVGRAAHVVPPGIGT